MFLKFSRKKKRHYLLSFFYKLDRLFPFSKERKLKLYLDLEWIFERLAHEKSSLVVNDHSVRTKTFDFLKSKLNQDFSANCFKVRKPIPDSSARVSCVTCKACRRAFMVVINSSKCILWLFFMQIYNIIYKLQ